MTPTPPATSTRAEEASGPSGLRRAHRAPALVWTGVLTAVLVVSLPAAVTIGPADVAPVDVLGVVGHHLVGFPVEPGWTPAQDNVVWLVRLPRVLLAAVVGAVLAVSGVALQALVRNVLAEPYLLGVTSGASTGAALTILFGVGAATGAASSSLSAFAGALLATGLVFALARERGRISALRLLLAGVAVGYVLSAVTSFLVFASDTPEGARAVLFWLLGSLSQARWSSVLVVGAVTVLALLVLVARARALDALSAGDDTAHTLGTDPERLRRGTLVVVAGAVGAAVAVSGGIGFVGLVVPHVARLCVGGAHRRLLPVAALVGASFLVWADVVARTAFAPRELPIGIVTAVVGAPFLVLLVRRLHRAVDA